MEGRGDRRGQGEKWGQLSPRAEPRVSLHPIEMSHPWGRDLERKGLHFSLPDPLQTYLINLHTLPGEGAWCSSCLLSGSEAAAQAGTAECRSRPSYRQPLVQGAAVSRLGGVRPGDPPTTGRSTPRRAERFRWIRPPCRLSSHPVP